MWQISRKSCFRGYFRCLCRGFSPEAPHLSLDLSACRAEPPPKERHSPRAVLSLVMSFLSTLKLLFCAVLF